MNDRQAAFVEEMGQYLTSVGMTPMAGRMLAWLLICDPAEQTAADLPPPKRERIQEFHDFVAYVERLVPAMLEQYLREREAARASAAVEPAAEPALPASP